MKVIAIGTGLVVPLLLFSALPRIFAVPETVVPTLTETLARFWEARSALLLHSYKTSTATASATAISYLLAALTILIAQTSTFSRHLIDPILVVAQVTPKVVFVPFLYMLTTLEVLPPLTIGVLIAFFPITIAMRHALDTIPAPFLWLAYTWRITRFRFAYSIAIPYLMPTVAAMFGTTWIYSIIGIVTTEMLRPQTGIGYLIVEAQHRIDAPLYFSAIICAVILSFCGWTVGIIMSRATNRQFRATNQGRSH